VDKRSKIARRKVLETTIEGLGTRFQPSQTLVLDGQSYLVSQLQQMVRDELDAMAEVSSLTSRRASAVKKERSVRTRNKPVLMALGNLVRNQFGPDLRALAAFALEPRKKGYKSPEVMAKAAEKAKRTRESLGTMGKAQRKRAIKSLKGR
jgi:hypothetical protein